MKIATGIVTYNPDIKKLEDNIKSIVNQTSILVICDNGSNNIVSIEKIALQYSIIVIKLKQNMGIAYALNTINEWCIINKYDWLLTLDQDSLARPGLIDNYKKYINLKNVAMMSCELLSEEEFKQDNNVQTEEEFKYIDKCYTSGSFINTSIIKQVGGFDEYLFIDFVDFDMCITLLENSYKIIRVNYLGLIHEVGKTKEVRFLGRKEHIYNHNPIRLYYMSRNGIIYARKHKHYFGRKEKIKRILSVFKRVVLVLFYEKNKLQNLKKGVSGIITGFMTRKKQWGKNSGKKEILQKLLIDTE